MEDPKKERLKLIVKNMKLLLSALESEVYSDVSAYQPGKYDVGDDDDGYTD